MRKLLAFALFGLSACSGISLERKPSSLNCPDHYSEMSQQQLQGCLGLVVTRNQNNIYLSDSLVDQLDCRALNQENVFLRLKADAFAARRHMPILNFPSQLQSGQCWAMALLQRRIFYLARFGAQGLSPAQTQENLQRFRAVAEISRDLSTFYIAEPDLFTTGPLYDEIISADFSEHLANEQVQRFFNPFATTLDRLRMLSGPRERLPRTNAKTFRQLQASLAKGELPLVDIRPDVLYQHMLVVKGLWQRADGVYVFSVYDSNAPGMDRELEYRPLERQFYGRGLVRNERPLGVFMVEKRDMQKIRRAAYRYYGGLCEHLSAPGPSRP